MPMGAMRAGNVVIVSQRQARPHNGRLLTAARMHSRELPCRGAAHGFFFESSNSHHASIPFERSLPAKPGCLRSIILGRHRQALLSWLSHLFGAPMGLLYI